MRYLCILVAQFHCTFSQGLMWLVHFMVLSPWQPGHNCLQHIDCNVFIDLVVQFHSTLSQRLSSLFLSYKFHSLNKLIFSNFKKEVNFRGDGHFDWLILQTNICNILWCYHFDFLVTTDQSRLSLMYLCLLVAEFHCTF